MRPIMLGWIFKKNPAPAADTAPQAKSRPAPEPAAAPVRAPAPPPVDWTPALQAARGDDTALLALARQRVPLDIKLAAVEALGSEESLKLAEREFRSHDRRVHQLAKQRHQAQVARREAAEQAARLIETARSLLAETQIPDNRVVELDRAWQALDGAQLAEATRAEFVALSERLSALVKQRAEDERALKRWTGQSHQALDGLRTACAAAASAAQDRAALAAAVAAAQQTAQAAPQAAAGSAALATLEQALAQAALLDERLAVLDQLLQGPAPAEPAAAMPAAPAPAQAGDPANPAARAEELPAALAAPEPADSVSAAPAAPDTAPDEAPLPAAAALTELPAEPSAEEPSVNLPQATELPPTEAQAAVEATDAAPPAPDAQAQPTPATVEAVAPEAAVAASPDALAPAADAAVPEPAAVEAAAAEPAAAQPVAELVPEPAAADPAEASAAPPAADPAPAAAPTPLQRWQELPPLADPALAQLLNQRVEQWQKARDAARQARQVRQTQKRAPAAEAPRAARLENPEALSALLDQVDAALAAGQLVEIHKHLVAVDEQLERGTPDDALRARIDAVQAQYAQLKGWQHWAGGRARDELVLQAEALAAATKGEEGAPSVKLSIKQRSEVIDDMRNRWKELDRLGGATSRALWQRFDAALKTAGEPIAAHLAAQRAARDQNLLARQQLLEALEAVTPPEAVQGEPAPDWRGLASTLDHFQVEWRKLGPVEHTVPRKAQPQLVERLNAAIGRLEAPLREARRGAHARRESLIARAHTLASEAQSGVHGRELVNLVRALQAEWQQSAKALPLPRGEENALWSSFKGTIDSIFSAREAAFSARDAEFKGHAAERAALCQRLEGLSPDAPPAELRRTLAETETQWMRCGPAPRNEAGALEGRFRAAHDAVRRHIAGSAQRAWHASCDALLAKLAICEEIEHAGASSAETPADRDALAQRWSALPTLPPMWEDAVRQRAALPGLAARNAAPVTLATDALFLQLEAAWDLPSPASFESARREMKLLALKQAMEGRHRGRETPLNADQCFAALLARSGLDDAQRQRLGAVIATLRQRVVQGPG